MSKFLSALFISVSLGITIWRSAEASLLLWKFFRLNTEIIAKIKSCQIEKLSSSKFALAVQYSYVFQNQKWEGQDRLSAPYFPNSYAAREALAKQSSDSINIWIDSSCPTCTSVKKIFPFRSICYAISSLGVLLYFVYLKGHLRFFK